MTAGEVRDQIVGIMLEAHADGLRFYTHWDEDNFMFIVRPNPDSKYPVRDALDSDLIDIHDFGWTR